jgi:hypothetical protein
VFVENDVVGLEAGRVQVRDVVRHDIEFARKRDLPRQSDERGVLHRQAPHVRPDDKLSQARPVFRAPLSSPKAGGHAGDALQVRANVKKYG